MKNAEAYEMIHRRGADFAAIFLSKARDGKSFICPKCGSGDGPKGTGMTLTEDGEHAGRFKCWACDLHGDAIDIYTAMNGGEREDALREVCQALGIMLDEARPQKKPEEMTPAERDIELERMIKNDIRAAQMNQSDPAFIEYLNRRAIPLELAKRHNLGFLPQWRNPKALVNGSNPPPSPRLIIPSGKGYVARDTRAELTEAEANFAKMKAGEAGLFNVNALDANHPIFICEGELDALSFMAAGAEAIGTGGTSGRAKLIEAIKSRKEQKKHIEPLIIALDNDTAGATATTALTNELDKLKIRYFIRNPYGDHKDANEALVEDGETFFSMVRAAEGAEFDEYSNLSALAEIMETNANPPPLVKTGFRQLDTLLDGGIRGDELCFVGGVSSSGKSAFCLQVIDQIARGDREAGREPRKCIIFSAEMSRRSIINRSLSRETAQGSGWNYTSSEIAGYGIEKNARYFEAVEEARARYEQYAGNIIVYDMAQGIDRMKPHAIEAKISRYLNVHRGEPKPVVLIDYLQILPPEDNKGDIRASINRAVEILAGIAHGLQVPTICISSLSRENYTTPLNMAALKESGNIEYGADIILGVQFEAIHYEPFTEPDKGHIAEKQAALWEEKHKSPRKMEISLIKRRDGRGEGAVTFDYDARHNLFTENQSDEEYLSKNYGNDEESKRRARAMLTGHRYTPEEANISLKIR